MKRKQNNTIDMLIVQLQLLYIATNLTKVFCLLETYLPILMVMIDHIYALFFPLVCAFSLFIEFFF